MADYVLCCKAYFHHQAQTGSGLSVYDVQRGHGILGNLARTIIPFFKSNVAPRLISGAAGFANDLLQGRSLKESAKKRGIQTLKNTFQDKIGRA